MNKVVSDSSQPHELQPTKAPPSMGVSRQEYWSGVPLPSLAMWMTQVQFLGCEDPMEKGMAPHSNILSWRRKIGGLQSMGSQRIGHY